MTAIAAKLGTALPRSGAATISRMLGAMRARGDFDDVTETDGGALGASHFVWEPSASRVARSAAIVAVADATLYYREDLRRALTTHGVASPGGSPAELIAAAYLAFGERCVEHLEGDFAFVIFDVKRASVFAARDFVGKRTLYYAATAEAISLASTIGGVVADAGVSKDLNLSHIAATAAGMWAHAAETCYRAVTELPAGHQLTWDAGSGVSVSRYWNPPAGLTRSRESHDDAAQRLLALLTRATGERLASEGATAVTLSGGWDSTAVYGAGQNALRNRATPRSLRAVSISYPEGDAGREDEFIAETAAMWQSKPAWIPIDTIPMFGAARDGAGGAIEAARERDEPFAHPYESWNRALARTASSAGAHVVLDGSGGDQLFQVSDIYLADLFASGQWLEVLRQWRSREGGGVRGLYRWAIRPNLPDAVVRGIARVRRMGAPRHYLDRLPSAWCRHAFLREHGVIERDMAARPVLTRASTVLAETHAFLVYPYFPRVTGRVASFALREGAELRSPLLDARVVDFAARRPWYERANRRETKILLRRSMRGLLPERLLAPRERRTGTTSDYFKRSLQGPGRAVIDDALREPRLAQLGIVDPTALQRAWDYYLKSGNEETGLRIFFTVQTELWLRARE